MRERSPCASTWGNAITLLGETRSVDAFCGPLLASARRSCGQMPVVVSGIVVLGAILSGCAGSHDAVNLAARSDENPSSAAPGPRQPETETTSASSTSTSSEPKPTPAHAPPPRTVAHKQEVERRRTKTRARTTRAAAHPSAAAEPTRESVNASHDASDSRSDIESDSDRVETDEQNGDALPPLTATTVPRSDSKKGTRLLPGFNHPGLGYRASKSPEPASDSGGN